ncbi:MAG TPA: sensor histidine kinase [Chiayiivirga sp.]|nr:sensor histidine kinase [Xanthomonadaceae bacterium]HRN59850.1 sensor histidine kinase [Chiayiivirga sp.]
MNSALPTATMRRWLIPASGSLAEQELRAGRSPWLVMIHLVWSVWVFMTPLFSGGPYGFTPLWFILTAISYPLFLLLYLTAIFAAPRIAYASALAMVGLCFVLLPWYPSGLSYFVFGCVMMQPRRSGGLYGYLALLIALNVALVAYASHIGYVWQAMVWIPTVTAIIGVIVMVERVSHQRDAALKLSHEEVRRLAATAERERIGRDLHDLLGHTLSMVALKSDLAARLVERDPAAAREEITQVGHIARDALTQVRGAVSGIRAAGIAAELASAKLLLETDGTAFDYRIDTRASEVTLPSEVENTLAMAVREAATNIQRHARARHARIEFLLEADHAVLRIADDGRGGVITPGNGLAGMRERIGAVNGELHIDSPPGEGTKIEVRVPLGRKSGMGNRESQERSDLFPASATGRTS